MSTKPTKGIVKTPRFYGKIERPENTTSQNDLETVSYDYQAAVSQPDLTEFFKSNTLSTTQINYSNDIEEKDNPQSLEEKDEVFDKLKNDKVQRTINNKSVLSLCPKGEKVETTSLEKSKVSKYPKSSKIPRARFTGFSRLPMRNRAKKSSTTRICTTKSKSVVAGEARQVQKPVDTKETRETIIENQRLPDEEITVVVSGSKSIFSEEKCSGIEGDVELDADHEFTTSTDNSPGRIINRTDPSIASILRASKVSCACRSCNDPSPELRRHFVKPDIWSDSRSSPEIGRYTSSGRNGRPKTRRLAENSKGRGYLNDSTDESVFDSTTDSSIYEPSRQKRTGMRREISCDIPKPVGIVMKSSVTNPAARIRTRPRLRFSFFNTLFDIVFWPFIFLRNDH